MKIGSLCFMLFKVYFYCIVQRLFFNKLEVRLKCDFFHSFSQLTSTALEDLRRVSYVLSVLTATPYNINISQANLHYYPTYIYINNHMIFIKETKVKMKANSSYSLKQQSFYSYA